MTEGYDFDYLYEAGRLRGVVSQIGVRADPDINHVDSFAVVLFFESSDGTVVEVAKVDDSTHEEGNIHVDRYYRERDSERKDFDVQLSNVWEADEYLLHNWERFVRAYLDTHGKQPPDED
ncbi:MULTISPECIES: DUF7718 family protein [Haloferacaceae]|uniref:DUF7718 domain-containing protein n=1 Tax=Halorubrum glutamatedens TaxID=2707018 RepID=A0ABD5QNM4_9EURY|nr:hypothetical protein [Halobellus captivus]